MPGADGSRPGFKVYDDEPCANKEGPRMRALTKVWHTLHVHVMGPTQEALKLFQLLKELLSFQVLVL